MVKKVPYYLINSKIIPTLMVSKTSPESTSLNENYLKFDFSARNSVSDLNWYLEYPALKAFSKLTKQWSSVLKMLQKQLKN